MTWTRPSLSRLAVTLIVLLGVYVTAYYATAKVGISLHGPFRDRLRCVVEYRCPASLQAGVRAFFAPVHEVDRRIRTKYWGGAKYDPRGRRSGTDARSPPSIQKPSLAAEALNEETEIEFVETPLHEALAFLADLHQIEIRLDPSADSSAPVTAVLSGVPLREALTRILRPRELGFEVEQHAIRVSALRSER